ncbi:MAG TPA: (2Fe-2S)-binding protein [Lachnoclostridium sp.]|jgi:NAD(P)H-nitrite reductase large subunit|uniref:(2Fe-2S)-binding protein n=1 Tax=Lacrimispora sp. TaxID=2719234 RepID=UPI000EE7912F|nr:(2Fe-2S)-binding protein [Lacrimispora sp.]HCD44971.1 (2Fe-2S)-binding protein [Lachnoclostridium sp.]
MDHEEIICYCSKVTKREIINALVNGAKTLDDIRKMTGACTLGKCKELSPRGMCCSPTIIEIIEQYKVEN